MGLGHQGAEGLEILRQESLARTERPRHVVGDVDLEFVGVSFHDLLGDVPHDGRPLRVWPEALEGGPALRDTPIELAPR